MDEHDGAPDRPRIGWLRAIVTAFIIVGVGIVVCVLVPNWVLTKIHSTSLDRGNLDAIATGVFFIGLFAIAFALRALQKRKVI